MTFEELLLYELLAITQPTFACSNLIVVTPEKCVKSIQRL